MMKAWITTSVALAVCLCFIAAAPVAWAQEGSDPNLYQGGVGTQS